MSTQLPVLSSVTLFVREMSAALGFYRRLGLTFPEGAEGHVHVAVQLADGLTLEFDTVEMTKRYDTAWQDPAGGSRALLQFMLPSREAVDELFGELTGAGYRGHLAPFDAFWGARYAAVNDPDGNLVGITSAQDPARSGPIP